MAVRSEGDYPKLIGEVGRNAPQLAKVLRHAEMQRRGRLGRLLQGGLRLEGLDELLQRLEKIEDSWSTTPALGNLAFLVARAIYDLNIAFEAGISGYSRTATDAMRDLMEIELLFLDFFVEPDHVEDWLGADRKRLLSFYGPGSLRKRIKAAGLNEVLETEGVEVDYQAHSQSVHVSPYSILESISDYTRDGDAPIQIDLWLVEIFEHGRRLCNAMLLYSGHVAGGSAGAQAVEGRMNLFMLAHQRVHEFVAPLIERLQDDEPSGDD